MTFGSSWGILLGSQFRQDIIPPASGGSTLGSSPSWTCLKNHIGEMPRRLHNLISEPPQLSSFDVKKHSVYSELFPDVLILSLWSHLWVQSSGGGCSAWITMLILVTTQSLWQSVWVTWSTTQTHTKTDCPSHTPFSIANEQYPEVLELFPLGQQLLSPQRKWPIIFLERNMASDLDERIYSLCFLLGCKPPLLSPAGWWSQQSHVACMKKRHSSEPPKSDTLLSLPAPWYPGQEHVILNTKNIQSLAWA